MTVRDDINTLVGYQQPNEKSIAKIGQIRKATADLIEAIMENCPHCPDKSAAIRKAREAMMTANAAIVVPSVHL